MNRLLHFARHRANFPGAPETCPPDLSDEVLAKMSLPQNHGAWSEFVAAGSADVDANSAIADMKCPMFQSAETPFYIEWPEEDRPRLVAVCRDTVFPGDEDFIPTGDMACVLEKFLNIVGCEAVRSVLRIPTDEHEDHVLTLLWSRVRCTLAGFGYALWEPACLILQGKFAACPFQPKETYREWVKANKAARHACGWPLNTAWLRYRDLPNFPNKSGKGKDEVHITPPDFLLVVALLHVIKHTRWIGPGEVDAMIAGRYVRVKLEAQNLAASVKRLAPFLSSTTEKMSGFSAVAWALSVLERGDLLPRHPLGAIPGQYLINDATRPVCSGILLGNGWFDHGMVMADLFELSGETVVPTTGDDSLVMDWRWNDLDIQVEAVAESQRKMQKAIPTSVPRGSPSAYLRTIFPNWRILLPPACDGDGDGTAEERAYLWNAGERAWFDAVFCCDLLRSCVPALRQEFPIVACLPDSPQEMESTDQGKTLFTTLLSNISVFGLNKISVPMSSSPPDTRVVVGILRRWGTACLDEFCVPPDQMHPLGRNQLNSMTTGGAATAGLVMENATEFRLMHPLFLSSKALDMSADLYTRVWPIFLERLHDKTRANMNQARDLNDGRISLTAKLMAWRLTQKLDLATVLNGDLNLPTAPGVKAHRFFAHRTCAAHLMAHYCQTERHGMESMKTITPELCAGFLDEVITARQTDVANHTQMAERSGVLDQIRSGTMVRIPWAGLWEHLSKVDTSKAITTVLAHGQTHEVGNRLFIPVGKFLQLYSDARDFRTPKAMVETLTGQQGKWGLQALAYALSTCVRSYYHGQLSYNVDNLHWIPVPGGTDWQAAVFMQGTTPYLSFREVKHQKKERVLDPLKL
jgi:hypothetical protein